MNQPQPIDLRQPPKVQSTLTGLLAESVANAIVRAATEFLPPSEHSLEPPTLANALTDQVAKGRIPPSSTSPATVPLETLANNKEWQAMLAKHVGVLI
jgi:hypothetical protein